MALAAAMAGPWAGVVALTSPVTAAGATARTVCHGVHGTTAGKTGRLTGCTKATTGGSGVIQAGSATLTDLVTWVNGGTTTIKITNSKPVAPDACASGSKEFHFVGKVTVSTGPAASISGGVSAFLCESTGSKGMISLLPGTVFKL
jgi:hypothetical protein